MKNYDNIQSSLHSNSTLHWIPDHPAVLRGVHRALKPGGRMFFSMSGRGTAAVVLTAIDELAEHQPWSSWLAHVPVPWYFFGPEEYHVWLQDVLRTAWMPYTNRVAEEYRAEFVRQVARRVLARCPPGVDGSVLLPMMNLEVEAFKCAA